MSTPAKAGGTAAAVPDTALATPAVLEPWQVLAPDGTLAAGHEPSLDGDGLLAAFRLMLLSRQVDERAFSLQRQGRLGTFSQASGQEAAVVGSAMALDPARDWVVPQYRELAAMIRQGYPLVQWFLYFKGDPRGNGIPEGVNLLPFQISLAAQIPQAVGLAWGLRHQGTDGVALTYFGDGASSEGDAHEAMNLAGVRRAPVVFFLQNNGWAISTPVRRQTATSSFALRAPGYGFPGVLVDGNDLLAVHEATRWAVERARAGEGPTLIEARTYRLGAHNTADDPTRYVPPEELEQRRALEPLARVRVLLQARGLLDEAGEAALTAELVEEVNDAFAQAEALVEGAGGAEGVFDHVYENAPQRVANQREALCRR
jgi:pyruvate dehydrogenase E1 component alpha subunit